MTCPWDPAASSSVGLPPSPMSHPCSTSGSLNRIQPFISQWLGTGLFSLPKTHLFPFRHCLSARSSPGKPMLTLSPYPTWMIISSPVVPENLAQSLFIRSPFVFIIVIFMCISPTRMFRLRISFYFIFIFSTSDTKLNTQYVLNRCFLNVCMNEMLMSFHTFFISFLPSVHLHGSIHNSHHCNQIESWRSLLFRLVSWINDTRYRSLLRIKHKWLS